MMRTSQFIVAVQSTWLICIFTMRSQVFMNVKARKSIVKWAPPNVNLFKSIWGMITIRSYRTETLIKSLGQFTFFSVSNDLWRLYFLQPSYESRSNDSLLAGAWVDSLLPHNGVMPAKCRFTTKCAIYPIFDIDCRFSSSLPEPRSNNLLWIGG